MTDIKDNIVLIRQIAAAAYEAGIEQIELIIALIVIGSGADPYVANIDATQRANLLFPRPIECSPETETMMQKTRWGLMQLRGSIARSLGFTGWLPALIDPELNLTLGGEYLAELIERYGTRYGIEGVIAAYQTETPRRIGDRYVNQGYVDAVLKLMDTYKPLSEEIRQMVNSEVAQAATGNVPNDTFAPVADHTKETLNELSKAQLVGLAKAEYGLELSALSKKDTLISQILVAQADRLDFTAEDLEGQEGVSFGEKDTGDE